MTSTYNGCNREFDTIVTYIPGFAISNGVSSEYEKSRFNSSIFWSANLYSVLEAWDSFTWSKVLKTCRSLNNKIWTINRGSRSSPTLVSEASNSKKAKMSMSPSTRGRRENRKSHGIFCSGRTRTSSAEGCVFRLKENHEVSSPSPDGSYILRIIRKETAMMGVLKVLSFQSVYLNRSCWF